MGDLIPSAILQYIVSASFSCLLWSVRVNAGQHGIHVVWDLMPAKYGIVWPSICTQTNIHLGLTSPNLLSTGQGKHTAELATSCVGPDVKAPV